MILDAVQSTQSAQSALGNKTPLLRRHSARCHDLTGTFSRFWRSGRHRFGSICIFTGPTHNHLRVRLLQPQPLTFIYLDNIGANAFLISKETIKSVTSTYPRNKWSNCFADAMVAEMELKPWCHTTANEGFIEAVLGNTLMEPYDN
jgi:hypothetical protein